ncbi:MULTISPECIES: GntR family transcriptional regulator [Aerococcus]|uniref:GntR family transcriptional regulator n=1 Tax=Aerococcus TaxID=1375 RepID=UPI000DCD6525|nr:MULTISPECIES: GntR family transcriptional regulator [Aerococcus]KAA9295936.1 GntR family transcriptional regulator [Aerococcus tenax]MDK6689305.1 GntR family transcriptional regulator [Aerococcus urinae]MDK8133733.1 GntR family transcriptional regulator [Aerococcus urinae]MDK8485434.1 GntR family transcriptional regulator [Aerococcus urinae]MDL5177785.1 GntR family transcriptional regulator [Aerococcus tenax]
MNIQISNASDQPIYLQIKNQIKAAIISGEVKAGDQLPSIRFLAKELRVSVITTKRAFDELEMDGFVDSVPGKGNFVSDQNSELIRETLYRKVEDLLREAIQQARLAGLTIQDLQELLITLGGESNDSECH